jgi:putative ABC transport system permease protein
MKPPPLADRLLRSCLPRGTKGLAMLGDLREDYHARLAGGRPADWWYWREALLLSLRYMNVTNDLRVAVRSLRHNAASSAIIVFTLGVALGASTIGFSFADLAVLRGLPVDDGQRVVQVFGVDARLANGRGRLSSADFRDMKSRVTTLSRFAAFQNGSATILDRGIPKSLSAARVTADFFSAMGQKPYLGRLFEDGDDTPGHADAVVVPHRYWQDALGRPPDVVGRPLFVDGRNRTIIGVASPDIELGNLATVDIWLPLEITAGASRSERTLSTMGRLRDGVTLAAAQAEIAGLAKSLAAEYPKEDSGFDAVVLPIAAVAFGNSFWVVISLFVAAVTLIMIIASANAASLVLARAMARRREIALRAALGAGQFRLLRQALVEGLVLSALAVAIAVPVAELGLRTIRAFDSEPALRQLWFDAHEFGFIAVAAIVTPLLFSVLPMLVAIRFDLRSALQSGGARIGGGAGRGRTILVAVQLALAVMLLTAAGLAVRSAANLANIDAGIRTAQTLAFALALENQTAAVADPRRFIEEARRRLQQLTGVQAVHAFEMFPILSRERLVTLQIDGVPVGPGEPAPWAVINGGDSGALEALGVQLLAGRWLTDQEDQRGDPTVLLGRSAATLYFGSVAAAIGHRLVVTDRGDPRTVQIVGVATDVLGNDLERGAIPRVWTGLRDVRRVTMIVSTTIDPLDLAPTVRREMAALAPMIPLDGLDTLDASFARFRSSDQVIIGIFAGFALLALLLAATGLYGLITYTVAQRTGEFGTRFALGARPADVLLLVVVQVARLLGVGLTAGLAGGLVIGYGMRSLLFGVSSVDPATLLGVATLMAVIAVVAGIRPAIRAARVNLVDALRAE